MKKNINITIDEELYNYIKDSGKRISTTINDLLARFFSPKEANKEEEKALVEELEIAKKFNLSEQEFFLIKQNFFKDVAQFWKLNKTSFTNVKSIFELVDVRRAFQPLWAKNNNQKPEVKKQ